MDEYGTLLGYTQDEIHHAFDGYLERAAEVQGLSKKALMERLMEHYDGFCFSKSAQRTVFSPWSLLKFLSFPKNGFENYWFESGGKARALVEYFKSHSLKSPLEFALEKTIALEDLSLSSDLEVLSDLSLLTQAGYLTIKRVEDDDTVVLGYPNREVAQSMARLYTDILLKGKTLAQIGADRIVRRLMTETPEEVFRLFNRIFLSIDAQKNPVRLESEVARLVQVFLAGAGLAPRVETVNALGRSDLEVTVGSRCWVFEFKVKRRGEGEEKLLTEALDQMRRRRYGEEHGAGELVRMAMVFSVEERQFIRWAVLPEGKD